MILNGSFREIAENKMRSRGGLGKKIGKILIQGDTENKLSNPPRSKDIKAKKAGGS